MKPQATQLMRRALQALSAEYSKGEPPLTLTQYAILSALRSGPQNAANLCINSGVDRSTMSASLRLLRRDRRIHALEFGKRHKFGMTVSGMDALMASERVMAKAEAKTLKQIPLSLRDAFLGCLTVLAESP